MDKHLILAIIILWVITIGFAYEVSQQPEPITEETVRTIVRDEVNSLLHQSRKADERLKERIEKFLDNFAVRTVTVTAYAPLDPNAKEGMCYSGDPTITTSGAKVVPGVTIAAEPGIPFGTVVWLEGLGFRTVQDRGGSITEGRMDIAVKTRAEALRWGRRERKVIYEGV